MIQIVLKVLLGVVIFSAVGFIVSYVIVNYAMYSKFFKRIKDKDLNEYKLKALCYDGYREEIFSAADRIEKLPHERLTVKSRDGLNLSARYYGSGSDKLVMFCHGAHAVPLYNFAVIAEEYLKNGYDILLIDERAHGKSEGKLLSYGKLESEDVLCWLKTLKSKNLKRIVLYGTSMGATSIAFASDAIADDRVKAMVIDCGYCSLTELERGILAKSKTPLWIVAGAFLLGSKKAEAAMKESSTEHLSKTNIPALFLHGAEDAVVDKSQSEKAYNACASDKKEIIIVDGAGHTLSSVVGGNEVRKKIIAFSEGENNRG